MFLRPLGLPTFLEVVPGHFVLLAVEVVSAYRKPADWMAGVVLNQVMRAIVQISSQPQIQQAGHVYWEDLETQGIFPDGPQA